MSSFTFRASTGCTRTSKTRTYTHVVIADDRAGDGPRRVVRWSMSEGAARQALRTFELAGWKNPVVEPVVQDEPTVAPAVAPVDLGSLPSAAEVVDAPHVLYIDGERRRYRVTAERLRKVVENWRFKGLSFSQDSDGALCTGNHAYVPQLFHMRTVNGGTPERIDSKAALREINNAMMNPGKDGVREMSEGDSGARIVYKGVRGVVELRPATREEAAAVVKPESERYAPGDYVIVRPVTYDAEKRRHRVLPEFVGTVGAWSRSQYSVRMVVADEHGRGVRFCDVRELRPATEEERVSAVVQAFADPVDEDLAAFYAETHVEVANGLAVPVRADRVQVGMAVIAAVGLETRTVETVTSYAGTPGSSWVRITWAARYPRESTWANRRVLSPECHVIVTVNSLMSLHDAPPAENADRERRMAAGRKAYEENALLEAQILATNTVIAERATEALRDAGHQPAQDGQDGFLFRVNHLVVGLYAQADEAKSARDALDSYGWALVERGWMTEDRYGIHGSYLAVLPPAADARAMVEEGARRREATECRDEAGAAASSGG
ncbi:hypothetical protein AB0O57_29625 [Streptomyces sp. NPDC091201]|uniref:hypothetical protein n=1 Tax=Streptomyces sp. NPDC091201 TaxID=3155190 RepID=UPI003422B510